MDRYTIWKSLNLIDNFMTMKKIFTLLLVASGVFALSSCACSGNSEKGERVSVAESVPDEGASDCCEVCDSIAVRDSSLRRYRNGDN